MTTDNIVMTTDAISEQAAALMNALTEARNTLTGAIKKTDGFIIGYARNISAVCGEGWVYLIGKESAPVREERKLFDRAMGLPEEVLTEADKALKAKANTYWRRVRIAAGFNPDGKVSTTDTIDTKTLKELKTMLNRIFDGEAEDACPLSSAVKTYLVDAFVEMGGDMDTIGTKA